MTISLKMKLLRLSVTLCINVDYVNKNSGHQKVDGRCFYLQGLQITLL